MIVAEILANIGRTLVVTASAGVLVVASCGEPGLQAEVPAKPVTVLEVRCLDPGNAELAAPVRMVIQDGTAVELWCGDRFEVSGGTCRVRRGDDLTQVPCMTEPRPSSAGALGSSPPTG